MFIRLKHLYRNFSHHKGVSIIGISGLSLSMVAGIVIFHYLFFELSFDKFYSDADRIYRIDRNIMQVKNEIPSESGGSSSRMEAEVLNTSVSGIEKTIRLHPVYGDAVIKTGMDSFNETLLYYSDPDFFSFFGFKCLFGNPFNALTDPNSAAISKSESEKIFHSVNSIGQTFEVYDRYLEKKKYTVALIFDDLPKNTHLKINMLFPISDLLKRDLYTESPWRWANFRTYVKLIPDLDPRNVKVQLDKYAEKQNVAEIFDCFKVDYQLHPIKSIHFSGFKDKYESDIKPLNIYLVLFAGIIVIIVAWMNNFNLSLVRLYNDKRKIEVKRILGAKKLLFLKEFVSESIFVYVFAFFLAITVSFLLSGFIRNALGLNINFNTLQQYIVWASIIICFFLLSVSSGFLISLKGAQMLRKGVTIGTKNNNRTAQLLASSLTAFQFTGAIILICFSLLTVKQINYMMAKNVGFNKENILIVKSPRLSDDNSDIHNLRNTFRNEAIKIPEIKSVSSSIYIPGMFISSIQGLKLEDETGNHEVDSRMNWVGTDYLPLYGNRFIAGRNFSNNEGIEGNKLIINERLSKELGFSNPEDAIGKEVLWKQKDQMKQIIGVIADFFHESPEIDIYPIAFHFSPDAIGYYSIKLESNNRPDLVLKKIQNLYDKIHSGNPFEFIWLDNVYNAQYAEWIKMKAIFMILSLLAIFISVMGLVASIGILLTKRTKEIGIRKVNGARVSEILAMLNREFIKWVIIAYITAIPFAYFIMNKWLQNFAYKTVLNWWLFALAGLITIGIAIITVSFQSLKTASRNPVDSLRYE